MPNPIIKISVRKMIESQNVEFKSIWKDEYLRYMSEPIFEEKANGFQLILQKDLSIKENINVPLNVPLYVPINDRMTAILKELSNHNKLFIPELAMKFKVSEKTIRRDLSHLRENNLIEFVGSKKTGEWRIMMNKLQG